MPLLSDFVRRRAVFFNDIGEFVGIKTFSKKSKVIDFREGVYNVDFVGTLCFKVSNPIYSTKYYFYQVGNPDALRLNNKLHTLFNAESYNVMLKTNILKKLNDLANKSILEALMQPKNIIIILIILAGIYYFSTGGKLT